MSEPTRALHTAYFDCSSGVAGNMILGSLFSAGLSEKVWRKEMARLRLPARVIVTRVRRGVIRATHVEVREPKATAPVGLNDIIRTISSAHLAPDVTGRAIAIFDRLARAEARVHGTRKAQVHFHEVGQHDTIIDIVGSVLGLKVLGIEQVLSSAVNLGHGTVKFSHGILPVPAPATVELLKGIPVYQPAEETGELATPTGAAILRELAGGFGPMPALCISRIGYGAGSRPTLRPNVLRLFIGTPPASGRTTPIVQVLEANIDDMNPELFGHVMELLFRAGALDVYFTPVYMKKNRPGTLLSVVSPPDRTGVLTSIILTETSTLGVRFQPMNRVCLERESVTVKTRYGPIQVKVGRFAGQTVTVAPEYESCRRAARRTRVPLKLVYRTALAKAQPESGV